MANIREFKDMDSSWDKQPYGTVLGKSYGDYKEELDAQLKAIESDGKTDTLDSKDRILVGSNIQYKYPGVSDASIGGNDVLNPYSAFCLDDDIVHTVFKVGGETFGMGRVYSEIYDSKQQVLYLTFGIPKYKNLQTYLKHASKKELAEMNDEGEPKNFSDLGSLLTGVATLAIQLPWLPLIFAAKIISSIKNYKVTEYFYFRDTMPLYYRYVNTILSNIAVSMGIYANGGEASDGGNGSTAGVKSGANMTAQDARKYGMNKPEILKYGPDIFQIVCKRSKRLGHKEEFKTTDAYLQGKEKYNYEDPGESETIGKFFSRFWTGVTTGALEGANFLGFRVEKSGGDASESFSNSTQDSAIAQKLNAKVQASRDRSDGENSGGSILAAVDRVTKKTKAFVDAAEKLVAGDIPSVVAYLAAGNGYFDLPKQWGGSAGINRSLSFTMKLRARTGGDNVSIFQSIMVPLSCLLAAALPRAVGDSTFTSPFLVRAFCRGMYAVPAGLITSLSVTRGSSEFGWSLNRLPTVVDVNFTIEDLSPMLFMSIAGGQGVIEAIGQAFANNTKFHEYLNTLTGIGLKERYYRMGQLKRRAAAAALMARNTAFSSTYWGYLIGDSALVRTFMFPFKKSRVANN